MAEAVDTNRVLRLNSSFLEVTDAFFEKQGWILTIIFILSIVFLYMFYIGGWSLFIELFTEESGLHRYSLLWNIFSITFMICYTIFSGAVAFVFTNLFFATALIPGTHRPIRFCRKTQRVYGFCRAESFFDKNPRFFNAEWKNIRFYIKLGNLPVSKKIRPILDMGGVCICWS